MEAGKVWRSWRITLRNDTSLPSETVQPWRTFVDSSEGKRLQEEVKRVFGVDTLNYILALVTRSWMPFLRSDVLIEIIVHLDLRDIVQLSQVCRTFRNVCCKDFLWKRLYAKHFGGISPATQNLGWKEAFVMTWKQKTTKRKLVKQQDNTIQDMLEENVKIKLVM
ncbi:uncharacterized protein [Acropora muricata]|uniref:uncharacterized protein n=1 Tax=Acropora muricata TaxID=159855 RepID=UPI0034E3D3CD